VNDLDYNWLAEEYARNRQLHPGVLQALIDGGGPTAASCVLEVGFGTGNYIFAIQQATDCTCWGIDPSEQMLARARQRGALVTFGQGSAEEMEFPAASFDLVFSVDVIHHVADRPSYFREAVRVLRPGGSLCTVTDSPEDIRRRRPLSNYFPETVAIEMSRYPTIEALRPELTRAGFRHSREQQVELAYQLTDNGPYRDRAYSALHLIQSVDYERGLARLAADLYRGPVAALSLYTLVWAMSPHQR
jgi:ubiquinone/menaquinone biosynthesis C-methylase UbiE